MHDILKAYFNNLWQAYSKVTPSAKHIHKLLRAKSHDEIINDHIALRTFDLEKVNIDRFSSILQSLGYHEAGEYHFKEKKLFAKHFEHSEIEAPKIFVSQLLTKEFSKDLQDIVKNIVNTIDEKTISHKGFLYSARAWEIDYETYTKLLKESEYAAWLYVWGYVPNHFTVNVNKLKNIKTLKEVNNILLEADFKLNDVGGYIKGSPEVYLEQSSTLADKVEVKFLDKTELIPSCFYEFALRYKKDGKLYNGFVENSANAIFESTNTK